MLGCIEDMTTKNIIFHKEEKWSTAKFKKKKIFLMRYCDFSFVQECFWKMRKKAKSKEKKRKETA